MRAHIVQGGVIANTIEVESLDFMPGLIDADVHGGAVGDLWDGQTFTKPVPAVVVPKKVTRRQAKQALRKTLAADGFTLLSKVQPAIDAIADALERDMMQIAWDESTEFARDNASLIQLATAIGLDSAGIDDLFILAETL
jgi:NCAIR mutase (PurE)-related protein